MAMVMTGPVGGSINDEAVPYLEHKLSKNKWKSRKIGKECRNRQSRSNRFNHSHRRKRFYNQSQKADKGTLSSIDSKNYKHKRRLTNDTFINELINDIYDENQTELETIINSDNNNSKLMVLASSKRRRRRKKQSPGLHSINDDFNSSISHSLITESISDESELTELTEKTEEYPDNNYHNIHKYYSGYSASNNFGKHSKYLGKIDIKDEYKTTISITYNKPVIKDYISDDSDSDSDSDDSNDNWVPWPSSLPDPSLAPLVPAPAHAVAVSHPVPIKKTSTAVKKKDETKDEFPNFNIEEEMKLLGFEISNNVSTNNKENEEKEILVLEEKYKEEIDKIEELNEYAAISDLASRSSFKDYNKNDETTQMDPKALKKVFKEIKIDLPKNIVVQWNGSMFIRFDEENPRFLQALLTGLHDTPYENGLFLFDIYLHKDYPNSPLKIKHVTKGGNLVYGSHTPGGFSPNLHRDSGKVCLSLLGTWGTNQWDAKTSNIYQVLSSILFWIFGAKWAYYMEPSYGGWELTAPMNENDQSKHKKEVIKYNYEIIEKCMKYAILETLRNPYIGYKEIINIHFKIKKNEILKNILNKWIKNVPSIGIKNKLIPLYNQIKDELNKL